MSRPVTRAAIAAGLIALLAGAAGAQEPAADLQVTLTAPQGEITVGDPVPLKLTVKHPAGAACVAPDVAALKADGPAGKDLTIEAIAPVESAPPGGGPALETAWMIRVRPFAPGDLTIGSVRVECQAQGSGAALSGTSPGLTLHVASVLKDPKEDAADIKGPWSLPRSWWLMILTLAIVLAGLGAIWSYWRRRRSRPVPAAPAPPVVVVPAEHPYHRALRELGKLLASTLLAQGRVKEFHVLLSEIVKRFLAGMHGFDALDRTTEEVLAEMLARGVSPDLWDEARRFLQASDLVKFAKHHPGSSEIDATVAAARALIESGRPRATEAAA